jgi:hypothetical protein
MYLMHSALVTVSFFRDCNWLAGPLPVKPHPAAITPTPPPVKKDAIGIGWTYVVNTIFSRVLIREILERIKVELDFRKIIILAYS